MITQNEKKSILDAFNSTVDSMVQDTCGDIDVLKFMEEKNVEALKRSITKVHNNVIASIPDEVPTPHVSVYTTPVGSQSIDVVTISITNRYTSEKKFKFSNAVTRKNATAEGIAEIFKEAYTALILDSMIEENLKVVNDMYAQLAQQAEIGYGIELISSLNAGEKKVSFLADDKVVFVADENRIFSLEDIILFSEPDTLIPEEKIEEAKAVEVEMLRECQTPEQLVAKHGGVVISFLSDINKQVRTMTLIKKVCTKEWNKIKGNKETLAYWSEGDNYALVVRREDGHFEVVLSPFNTETLRKVDVDVLSKIA